MNNKQIYIIGDVHGCYKTLLALIDQFPNKQNSKIVFVGDLIDKGTNSCEVVEFIINNKYDCVMGNHEELFLEYAPNKDEFENDFNIEYSPYYFERCGGKATIESYKSKEVYSKHYDYIQNLPLYLEYKDYKMYYKRLRFYEENGITEELLKEKPLFSDIRLHLEQSRFPLAGINLSMVLNVHSVAGWTIPTVSVRQISGTVLEFPCLLQ